VRNYEWFCLGAAWISVVVVISFEGVFAVNLGGEDCTEEQLPNQTMRRLNGSLKLVVGLPVVFGGTSPASSPPISVDGFSSRNSS